MADSVGNKDLYDAINDFRQEAQKTYVTIDKFNPVAKVVYGTAGMVGVAFLTAVIAAVLWIIPNAQKANPTSVAKAPTAATSAPVTGNSNPASTPTATAAATSRSDSTTPTDTQVSSSGGLVSDTLKGVGL